MKILYLSPSSALGGAERSLVDIISAVGKLKPDWQLELITAAPGPLLTQAAELGAASTVLELPPALAELGDSRVNFSSSRTEMPKLLALGLTQLPGLAAYLAQLRRKIRDISPNVVHSNGLKTHLLLGCTHADFPAVCHIRDFVGRRRLVRRVFPWLLPRRAVCIANSAAVRDDLLRIASAVPCRVIYNAVDTGHFCPGSAAHEFIDRAAGMPLAEVETKRIGVIGAFGRWKGLDLFLDAAANVVKTLPQQALRFYIVGGPIYQTKGSQYTIAELRNQVACLGLEKHVGFTGFQEDPRDFYRALDIVVHCATQPEPFGRTIVEAMSCGRCVIAASAGGARELFTHEHDAYGITPGSVSALADAIVFLLQSPELCRRLAQNARQTVLQRFTRETLGAQLTALYQELAVD